MKKSFLYSFLALAVFSACKKTENLTGPTDTSVGYVSFTNVNASNKLTNVLVDGFKVSNVITTFASGATTTAVLANATIAGTYFGLVPGTHTLAVRDSNQATAINYYSNSINIEAGKSYSFFLYDTLTAGSFKGILLNTDRLPDENPLNAKVRFLNLSPRSPALDFWMIRRETAVVKDSVLLYASVPYLGNVATPDVAALSAFKSVVASRGAGNGLPSVDYFLRVKLAGSNTIVASSAATNIIPGRNYTFYTRGLYPAVVIASLLNN